MPTTLEDVAAKTETLEIDPKSGVAAEAESEPEPIKDEKLNGNGTQAYDSETKVDGEDGGRVRAGETAVDGKEANVEGKHEEVPVEVEPKTGVLFPVRLDDGKQLKAIGLRKKSMLGLGIKIYAFGIYADNQKLTDLMKSKIGKAPSKATKEMYQMVIDTDVGMTVKLIIVFSNLTMSMVRKNFDEGLGASIKKLTGGKNDELTKKIMGEATDDIKLTPGSEIEISYLPGYVLETKVKGEMVSKVESELLCRAYMYLYLGEDPFDKEAKEKFGMSLVSLF